jgi:hypothetical protein
MATLAGAAIVLMAMGLVLSASQAGPDDTLKVKT